MMTKLDVKYAIKYAMGKIGLDGLVYVGDGSAVIYVLQGDHKKIDPDDFADLLYKHIPINVSVEIKVIPTPQMIDINILQTEGDKNGN